MTFVAAPLSFEFIVAAHTFAVACGFIGGYLLGRGSKFKSMSKGNK